VVGDGVGDSCQLSASCWWLSVHAAFSGRQPHVGCVCMQHFQVANTLAACTHGHSWLPLGVLRPNLDHPALSGTCNCTRLVAAHLDAGTCQRHVDGRDTLWHQQWHPPDHWRSLISLCAAVDTLPPSHRRQTTLTKAQRSPPSVPQCCSPAAQ
jgi:hypothetical protein